jgi:hypothetical protein
MALPGYGTFEYSGVDLSGPYSHTEVFCRPVTDSSGRAVVHALYRIEHTNYTKNG